MKVIRSNTKLWIEVAEENEGIEIHFPNVLRAHYGYERFELIADDLRGLLGAMTHHLTRLALNAIDAERYAEMTGRPRWLVYDPVSGESYETPYPVDGAPKVEFTSGKAVWSN